MRVSISANQVRMMVSTWRRVPGLRMPSTISSVCRAVTATALVPAYYAVVTPSKEQGCFLEPTPAACKCATDFSCACLLSQNLFCNGTGVVGCDDSSGAPVVTCQ